MNQGDFQDGNMSKSLREKPSTSNVLRPVPSSATNTRSILRKTYYTSVPTRVSDKHGRHRVQHSTHQPESLDWFNVLIAQIIAQYRQTAYLLKDSPTSSILHSLNATLNNPEKKPSFIDTIKVTDISLGEEFPIFSNCRIITVDGPNTDGGRLQALMDVDLSDDNLSLAIETSLILNYPKPYSAILPVALSLTVVRFSGTLCISFIPAATDTSDDATSVHSLSSSQPNSETLHNHNIASEPSTGTLRADATGKTTDKSPPKKGVPKTNLAISFLPDYRLDLSVRSLIGSRSRLQDVPKVAQLVEARVQRWFEERMVEPRVQVVGLPHFWPRMGRTGVRPGEDAESGATAAAAVATIQFPLAGGPTVEIPTHSEDQTVDNDRVEGLRHRPSNRIVSDGVPRHVEMPGAMPDSGPAG
jgi:maintenance of mitochondrial morphology protein 1